MALTGEHYCACRENIHLYSSENLEGELSKLKPIQQTVIRESFGLDGKEPRTLVDIAETIGVTSSRVRAIKEKVLHTLRHPKITKLIVPVGFDRLKNNAYITEEEKTELVNLEDELWKTDAIVSTGEQSDIPKFDYSKLSILTRLRTELKLREQEAEEAIRAKIAIEHFSIEELELSVRAFNCLKRAGKDSAQDILEMTPEDFANVRNLGTKAMQEVISKFEGYGYVFDAKSGFKKIESKAQKKEAITEEKIEPKRESHKEKRSESDILQEMKVRREQLEHQLTALEEQTKQAKALLAEYDKIIGDDKIHTEDEMPNFKDE